MRRGVLACLIQGLLPQMQVLDLGWLLPWCGVCFEALDVLCGSDCCMIVVLVQRHSRLSITVGSSFTLGLRLGVSQMHALCYKLVSASASDSCLCALSHLTSIVLAWSISEGRLPSRISLFLSAAFWIPFEQIHCVSMRSIRAQCRRYRRLLAVFDSLL